MDDFPYRIIDTLNHFDEMRLCNAEDRRTHEKYTIKMSANHQDNLWTASYLNYEYKVLKDKCIDNVADVKKLILVDNAPYLLLESNMGHTLQFHSKQHPLEISEILHILIQIMLGLKGLHEKNIIHNNITLNHIMWNNVTNQIKLVDLHKAILLPSECLELPAVSKENIEALSFAPECFALSNQVVDHRSDIYSFGMLAYELLTKKLPFLNEKPEYLFERTNTLTPHSLDPNIPKQLSDIVMRCINVKPGERYQSSCLVLCDLNEFHNQLTSSGHYYNITAHDSFRPQNHSFEGKLYGRKDELHSLNESFDIAKQGIAQFVLLSGHEGVGKTSLALEMQSAIVNTPCYFLSSKCDKHLSSIPYLPIIHLIDRLVEYIILRENISGLNQWKTRLNDAIGNNTDIILNIFPSLNKIIKKKIKFKSNGALHSAHFITDIISDFLSSIPSNEMPIIYFIDDLHWADPTTLRLLSSVKKNKSLGYTMLLGTYCATEANENLYIDEMLSTEPEWKTININNLSKESVKQWIRDVALSDIQNVNSLAEMVYKNTLGNPYRTIQLLDHLFSNNLGRINNTPSKSFENPKNNLFEIKLKNQAYYTHDLISMVLDSLPASCKHLVRQASQLGYRFDLALLASINSFSLDKTLSLIKPALDKLLILPINDRYKYLNPYNVGPVFFKFKHDFIYDVCNSLPKESRDLDIYHYLYQTLTDQSDSSLPLEYLLTNVYLLNNYVKHIKSTRLKENVLRLNYRAIESANTINAYHYVIGIVRLSHIIMKDLDKNTPGELYIPMQIEKMKAEIQNNQFDSAITTYDAINKNTDNKLMLIKANRLHLKCQLYNQKESNNIPYILKTFHIARKEIKPIYDSLDYFKYTLRYSLQYLSHFILSKIHYHKEKKQIDIELIQLLTDRFNSIANNASEYDYRLTLDLMHLAKSNHHKAAYGLAYMKLAQIQCEKHKNISKAIKYAEYSQNLLDTTESVYYHSIAMFIYFYYIKHWGHPRNLLISKLQSLYYLSLQCDNQLTAGYCLFAQSVNSFLIAEPLNKVKDEIDYQKTILRRYNCIEAYYLNEVIAHTIGGLISIDFDFNNMVCESFLLSDKKQSLLSKKQTILVQSICKVQLTYLNFLFHQNDSSINQLDLTANELRSLSSSPFLPIYIIYRTLSLLSELERLTKPQRQKIIGIINKNLNTIKRWSENAPINYKHLYLLVLAERDRALHQTQAAKEHYQDALNFAKDHEHRADLALIYERYGMFNHEQSEVNDACTYLINAYDQFSRWGAKAKLHEMTMRYPEYIAKEIQSNNSTSNTTMTDTFVYKTISERVDLRNVIQSASTMPGDIRLEQLLEQTLNIVINNSGAERAVFIGKGRVEWRVAAEIKLNNQDAPFSPMSEPLDQYHDLPKSIIRYCKNTQKTLVLTNAETDKDFSGDNYVKINHLKSIMCVPILCNDNLIGILYLENKLIPNAFNKMQIDVVNMLATQIAVSLQNAQLFNSLDRVSRSSQRFVPKQFMGILEKDDISEIDLGDAIEQEISVLFSDIRNFTMHVEKLTPQSAFAMINRYWKAMAPIIRKHKGYIDQYQGDAIMAIFPNSAEDAINASIAMRSALKHFNQEELKTFDTPIEMGIGINTGKAILGIIGEEKRFESAVISDVTNTAARIEDLNKHYGTQILIGGNTIFTLKPSSNIFIRKIDTLRLKGKNDNTDIYELIDWDNTQSNLTIIEYLDLYRSAFTLYQEGKFKQSLDAFNTCLTHYPADSVTLLLSARCQTFLTEGSPKDWDGTYIMQHK